MTQKEFYVMGTAVTNVLEAYNALNPEKPKLSADDITRQNDAQNLLSFLLEKNPEDKENILKFVTEEFKKYDDNFSIELPKEEPTQNSGLLLIDNLATGLEAVIENLKQECRGVILGEISEEITVEYGGREFKLGFRDSINGSGEGYFEFEIKTSASHNGGYLRDRTIFNLNSLDCSISQTTPQTLTQKILRKPVKYSNIAVKVNKMNTYEVQSVRDDNEIILETFSKNQDSILEGISYLIGNLTKPLIPEILEMIGDVEKHFNTAVKSRKDLLARISGK